ncbi:hypothetical protein J3U75_06610 [Snodgrassella sp. B3088]|uniref:hypothetical protein n=1 Tax=Snodgrassella sp. B3088 TaxID=2818038 RepID=UPI0022698AB1|nr:hypothetical protein [Snodgrassella sp. B3088]MCX8749053.1 hypothetical protein [Snodgrassella sp. B3088]
MKIKYIKDSAENKIKHIKEWAKTKIKYIKIAAKLWLVVPDKVRRNLFPSEFKALCEALVIFCLNVIFLLLWLFPFPIIFLWALYLENVDKKEGI